VTRLVEVVRDEVARGALVALVTHEPRVFDGLVSSRVELERGKLVTR